MAVIDETYEAKKAVAVVAEVTAIERAECLRVASRTDWMSQVPFPEWMDQDWIRMKLSSAPTPMAITAAKTFMKGKNSIPSTRVYKK